MRNIIFQHSYRIDTKSSDMMRLDLPVATVHGYYGDNTSAVLVVGCWLATPLRPSAIEGCICYNNRIYHFITLYYRTLVPYIMIDTCTHPYI
jgi:hypothetical protein